MEPSQIEPPPTFMERVFTGILWIGIAISPALLGAAGGGIVVLAVPGTLGIAAGATVALTGVGLGIVWAEKERRMTDAVEHKPAVTASPDLDRLKRPYRTRR